MTQLDKLIDSLTWRDIKDAPRDGGEYDFVGPWILGKNNYECRTIRWTTEYPCSAGVWMIEYEPTDYIDNIKSFEPTHYMPLPTGKAGEVIKVLRDALKHYREEEWLGGEDGVAAQALAQAERIAGGGDGN